jgi:hypothetical protein
LNSSNVQGFRLTNAVLFAVINFLMDVKLKFEYTIYITYNYSYTPIIEMCFLNYIQRKLDVPCGIVLYISREICITYSEDQLMLIRFGNMKTSTN